MKKFLFLVFGFVIVLTHSQAQRVLNDDEKQQLITHTVFIQKCEWAIRDYAVHWMGQDGVSLTTAAQLDKFRREYAFVRQVARAQYEDPKLTVKFLMLAKGMTFNVDADPTSEEIIALFVAGNKFEELASLYFDLISE